MIRLRLLYFASLRDAAGVAAEDVETGAADLAALYDAVRARHGFALSVTAPWARTCASPTTAWRRRSSG